MKSTQTTYTIGDWSAVNNGPPYVDSAGCWWRCTLETGWSGNAAPRENPVPREQSDGDFDGDVWESARVITLGGQVIAPDQITLQKAMDGFNALLVAGGRFQDLVVAEAHLTRQCRVRRTGNKPVSKVAPFMGLWSISLYAADPYRYSNELHTGSTGPFAPGAGRIYPRVYPSLYGALGGQGLVTVSNAGDLDCYPVLTITAPTDSVVDPQVRLVGGSLIRAELTLAVGDSLVIDLAEETVLLNGVASRFTSLSDDSQFFACPPGDSQLLFTTGSGDGLLAEAHRDTYP